MKLYNTFAYKNTKLIGVLSIPEENVAKVEEANKKEIHHMVKNNLQVISSLISLQMEKFRDKDKEVIEAFKEIQSRITSIALIHEELYRSTNMVTLDFSSYLKKLIAHILDFYKIKARNINLKLNLEKVCLGMDTAISLGIIVNELISNSVKHAFPNESGEISVSLCKVENGKKYLEKSGNIMVDSECRNKKHLQFVLVIKDNGKGFP